jgi:hypothetical protein
MTSTTVLIYREWLQLLRFGSISVSVNRVIDQEAKSVQLLELLTVAPEIDYRDKTSLIACEFLAVKSDTKIEISVENVLDWIPLSQATLTDLEPEAERLKCILAKCPWGTAYEEFVRENYKDKLSDVLGRWLSSFQLEGDFEEANSVTVELPRVREITFPGKPFSGIFYAIDGHARNKPSDLRDSVKDLKSEYQREQYKGFGGYPESLKYSAILTQSTDQGFSLLALALLYTYTSLEKGLLDFCTFHNDVIWLSVQTSAQEALNVASIVGRHHGPEYMTGVYYSSSSNAAFVQDQEVTAYLATFQEDVAKRKQQSTGAGEQDDAEAIAPGVDQTPDSSVEESHDNTDVKAEQVAENNQTDGNSPGNDSSDAVASGDVSEPTDEQQKDKSPVQTDQPDSDVGSESESSGTGVAVTEPETITESDAQAPLGANQSGQVTDKANEGTDTVVEGDVAKSESESEVNLDAATSESATEDEDKPTTGDSSSNGDHNEVASLQSGEKPVVGNEHKEEAPTVGEQVRGDENTNICVTPEAPRGLISNSGDERQGAYENGKSTRKASGTGDSQNSKPKRGIQTKSQLELLDVTESDSTKT